MKNKKNLSTLLSVLCISLFLQTTLFAQEVSTFNGQFVHYGWNSGAFSEAAFQAVIDESFTSQIPKLDIQKKLDDKLIPAELLWKVTGSFQEIKRFKTPLSSWIWADARVTSFNLLFQPSGYGYVYLYQDGVTVGRFRCHTSSQRVGVKYLQLKPGQYKVTQRKLEHIVQEKGLEGVVLEHALCSGVDGKWIHEGEFAQSHGCVRVSEPAMIQMYRLVKVGTPFNVIWGNER